MSKNGRPRGFGFVTYDSTTPAFAALAEPQWLDGRLVDVKRAVPGERAQERTSNKIFVGGLPQDVGTEELKAYFSSYGAVADAVVMVDRRTSRSRGFGFVRFAGGSQGANASEAVLTDFQAHRLAGKWVEVKRATPAAILQELSPGGIDGLGSPSTLAMMESQMGAYLMDPSGWESLTSTPVSTPGGGPIDSPTAAASMAALRGHARGRRGRRRKQPFGLLGSGDQSDEDGVDDDDFSSLTSPCDHDDADLRAALLRAQCGSPFGAGSPMMGGMRSPAGSYPPGLSPLSGGVATGGAVALVPADEASADAVSALAATGWGGAPRPSAPASPGMPLSPLTVEPMTHLTMGLGPGALAASCDPAALMHHVAPGRRGAPVGVGGRGGQRAVGSPFSASCKNGGASAWLNAGKGTRVPTDAQGHAVVAEATSENDPGRANAATATGLPAGPNAAPMKVNCRDDSFEALAHEERFEGFTREDFLSLEVRPWLSAC
jgi:hypothetical protein